MDCLFIDTVFAAGLRAKRFCNFNKTVDYTVVDAAPNAE